jgi:hypothetical protein
MDSLKRNTYFYTNTMEITTLSTFYIRCRNIIVYIHNSILCYEEQT